MELQHSHHTYLCERLDEFDTSNIETYYDFDPNDNAPSPSF